MPVIQNPRTGDEFLDMLIVNGITTKTLRLMDDDIRNYHKSLSQKEQMERIRIWREAKAEYCR